MVISVSFTLPCKYANEDLHQPFVHLFLSFLLHLHSIQDVYKGMQKDSNRQTLLDFYLGDTVVGVYVCFICHWALEIVIIYSSK